MSPKIHSPLTLTRIIQLVLKNILKSQLNGFSIPEDYDGLIGTAIITGIFVNNSGVYAADPGEHKYIVRKHDFLIMLIIFFGVACIRDLIYNILSILLISSMHSSTFFQRIGLCFAFLESVIISTLSQGERKV